MNLYKFDMNKDWMDERNKAAARGDKAAAEQAERNRNQKIDALGLNLPKTYDFIDIGNEAKGLMQNNAPAYMIGDLMDARKNKAKTNPQYSQFANDEIQDEMARYYFNGISGVGGNHENRPTYENKRQTTIDELWNTVMNAPDFSYDAENDPVFQSYKDMYTREGQRAMQDTLASLSMDAGGDNSWAVSAAAQAQNRYMQELADKVPELYNLAYDRYLAERNADINKLSLARDMESADYNKYLNEMNIFQNDRVYADSLYNDYYNHSRADEQWDYETAQAELANYVQAGVPVPRDVLLRAGVTDPSAINALIEQQRSTNEYNQTIRDYELAGLGNNKILEDLALQKALGRYQTPVVVKGGPEDDDDDDDNPIDNTTLDSIVNKINDETTDSYGKNVIKKSAVDGSYFVEPAAKEKVVYAILNDGDISMEEAYTMLAQLNIDEGVIQTVVNDRHYKWR